MLLSCNEWRDNIRLCYGMDPLGLCKSCDGCCANFTVEYMLSCKMGGLVSIRHNNVHGEAEALAAMVTQKSAVSYEPPIYLLRYGRAGFSCPAAMGTTATAVTC